MSIDVKRVIVHGEPGLEFSTVADDGVRCGVQIAVGGLSGRTAYSMVAIIERSFDARFRTDGRTFDVTPGECWPKAWTLVQADYPDWRVSE